jgi:hypothetical protein
LQFLEFATADHLKEDKFKDSTGDFFDYETISDGRIYLSSLIKKKFLDEFIPFYVDGAHAIFAIWLTAKSKDIEKLPIVYIDTEGTYTVCASNFDEFVYLFSRGLIIQVSGTWDRYNSKIKAGREKSDLRDPFDLRDAEWIEDNDKYFQKHERFERFKKYVAEEMNISIKDNPVQVIKDAIDKHPNFYEYLESKGALVVN